MNLIFFINYISGLSVDMFDVTVLTAVVVITVNFYRLNSQIKYIKKIVIKITEKLGIELFDIDSKL